MSKLELRSTTRTFAAAAAQAPITVGSTKGAPQKYKNRAFVTRPCSSKR